MFIAGRACNTRFVEYIAGMDLLDGGAILGFIFRGVFVRYIWYLLYEAMGLISRWCYIGLIIPCVRLTSYFLDGINIWGV